MHGPQERCILEFPNFTDWSNVEKSVDGGAVDRRDIPPTGDNLDRSERNGCLAGEDYHRDRHAKEYANGFAEASDARTTQLGDEDFHGNPSNTSWKRGGRKWRLQMGLHVRGAVGETVEKSDTHKLLDGYCQMLELPDRHRDRVIELVLSDDKRNSWNRHHDGDLGATVGYAVLVLENDDRVRENDEIDAIELVKELCGGDDVDVDDVADFARRRADERGLNL